MNVLELFFLSSSSTFLVPIFEMIGQDNKSQITTEQPPKPETVREQLQDRLLTLNVRGYERLIAHLLQATAFEDVQILRDHRIRCRSHKGRNGHGGVDITALLRSELSATPVLVQVKQYRRPVSRRFVDELRGALLRTGAGHGLLITTSTFAPTARQAARENPLGPIELIDGERLISLLLHHRLGVRQDRNGDLRMHQRFFRQLQSEESLPEAR